MKRRIEPFEAPRIGSRVELINGTWFWINDQPEPDNDRCPSCGVPYVDHSGLIGTCKRVQELTADRDRYKRLAGELAGALRAMQTMSHYQEPRKLDEALTWRQNDMKAQEMCKTALAKAKQEGVIE